MSNSPASPFAFHPMPPGWISDYWVAGYYDGPTHGLAKTLDGRLYLFRILACSDSMRSRLIGFYELPVELLELAAEAIELNRGQDRQRAEELSSKVFEEALRSVDNRYGAQILALTEDFTIFHAVEMVEGRPAGDGSIDRSAQ